MSTVLPSEPLLAKQGNDPICNPRKYIKKWCEHFDKRLNRSSILDEDFLNSIPNISIKS